MSTFVAYIDMVDYVCFIDYQQATFRQYQRLTKQLKPDLEAYERQKEEL